MAKINHNSYLDIIDELSRDAAKRGVAHLLSEGDNFTGRELYINGKELINFGTCGYLGLETLDELKEGAIDFTRRFGTQFSISRTYLCSDMNIQLESYLSEIYKKPVIVSSSTSTNHIAVIPTLVREGQAVILDQQVHMSVQTGCQLLKPRGIPVEMIRHSNLEMLERKLKEWQGKYTKIWYMIDGVYSMYGDVAPIHEIMQLSKKYEALHIYVDDAHGMGWYGKNGAGYIFDTVGVPDNMILVTTLAKGFGVTGGVTVFPNQETFEKVKYFGGPLTYSHPIAPPLLGAAIASAKIHLSDEIYKYQDELRERIEFCNKMLDKHDLPVISNPMTPIYFVGMGHPRVGYNMVKRLLDDGFYLSLAMFPAVPVKNTGIRFTLTRHVELADIEALVESIARNFPKALEDENRTRQDVYKAFHLDFKAEKSQQQNDNAINEDYKIEFHRTIKKIDRKTWDEIFGDRGTFTWNGLVFLEEVFRNNPDPIDNWEFYYCIIRDAKGEIKLATFLTLANYKDDFIAADSVSKQIEEVRKDKPDYLTSKSLSIGSLLTEGQHLFIDRNDPSWKKIMHIFLEELSKLQEETKADNIFLRDFDEKDIEMRDFLLQEAFIKVKMPSGNIVKNVKHNYLDEFLKSRPSKRRNQFRIEALNNEGLFRIEWKKHLTDEEIQRYYDLYLEVKSRNYALNHYAYPIKTFQKMQEFPEWEFLVIYAKDEKGVEKPVVYCSCFVGEDTFTPMIIGMDYAYVVPMKTYKQTVYQFIKRAQELGKSTVYLGFTADTEKRKVGAVTVPKVLYVQAKDNFNFELIESMSVLA